MKIPGNFLPKQKNHSLKFEFPLLPLKNLVVFPGMALPIVLKDTKIINSAQYALKNGRELFMATIKEEEKNFLDENCFHLTGTIGRLIQIINLPDKTSRLIVEGKERAQIIKVTEKKDGYFATGKRLPDFDQLSNREIILIKTVKQFFDRYAQVNNKLPKELKQHVQNAEKASRLVDIIAAALPIKTEEKIKLLSEENTAQRLEKMAELLASEIEVQEIQKKIQHNVHGRMQKTQKQIMLNEQLKEIHKELGLQGDDPTGAQLLEEKIEKIDFDHETRKKIDADLKRLRRLPPISQENAVLRTYLEWIADLPWNVRKKTESGIKRAQEILDEDHYGLEKAKERILDYIAVQKINQKVRGPILCLVGPPGTGKTSLGQSISRALDRDFVRISLGGLRDEAEIRGHRKTYVGALPGKIIQAIKKAGSSNPVILLDEVDKMSYDYRGDPASALLEVLDPQQNYSFVDHYMEVSYDLSDVMFITTANSMHNIPYALQDRMEVIEVPGYTAMEKKAIARRYLIPRQLKENGLEKIECAFSDSALEELIFNYTRESGVRNLEREIARIIRKVAREYIILTEKPRPILPLFAEEIHSFFKQYNWSYTSLLREKEIRPFFSIDSARIKSFLGRPPIKDSEEAIQGHAGISNGLAWTERGGRLLPVETAFLKGKEKLILTGNLGDVMKESAQIALSYARACTGELGIKWPVQNAELHIHVPAGAIPKDGPSAGITLTAAILSALIKIPLRESIAMTGEITLTGRLLPIGGVKEKVLAAHRHQIKKVLLPLANKDDLVDVPPEIQDVMDFHFFDSALEALNFLFPEGSLKAKKSSRKKSNSQSEST